MKQSIYFLLIVCLTVNINCSDDEDERAVIGTLDGDIINLAISPEALMDAFEEEYASEFSSITIDSIYFLIGGSKFIVGEGTTRYTDADGNSVSGHIIARVPYELDGDEIYLTADNMNKGESCSGAPCSSCAFNPTGGCTCLLNGTCNHTITKLTHNKGAQGGFNDTFEC